MANAEEIHKEGTTPETAVKEIPLVVRIYGVLKKRIIRYSSKKGIQRATAVKLLMGEALERENF